MTLFNGVLGETRETACHFRAALETLSDVQETMFERLPKLNVNNSPPAHCPIASILH